VLLKMPYKVVEGGHRIILQIGNLYRGRRVGATDLKRADDVKWVVDGDVIHDAQQADVGLSPV
jgi:hypothetical protein